MAFDSKKDAILNGGDLFPATRDIAAAFEEKELKFKTDRHDDTSLVRVGFRTDRAGNVDILFLSSDEDYDVSVRCFQVISGVEKDKRAAVLEAINECNHDYRFAKFILDDDGDINLEYDFPVSTTDIGEMAYEIAIRFTQVIDDAYPTIMKALWG